MLSRRATLLLLACVSVLLFASLSPLRCSALTKKGVGLKLSNKDLDAIEDQWMDDEVEDEDDTPFKFKRTAEGGRMPPAPAGPKTEMSFVTIKSANRKETDKLAGRWSDQMSTGGIDVRGYTIEDNRLLFVCDQRGYKDMNKVRDFVLRQPETVDFEWNSKKSVPGDVFSGDDDAAAAKPDPMAQFQAMQDEQAAQAKRAQRKAKKEKEARLRKKKADAAKKKKAAEDRKRKAASAAAAAEAAAAIPTQQQDVQAAVDAKVQKVQAQQQAQAQQQLKQEL